MSKKSTIILIIVGVVFFVLGMVLLDVELWYLGLTSMFLAILILSVVAGTHFLYTMDKLKAEEQMYRDKIDKLHEFMEWYKNEKGGGSNG